MPLKKMEQQEAIDFFAVLYYGEHHIPGNGLPKPFGLGWCVNHQSDMSTFDFDFMTRLVFLAHDRAVRASIMPSGPGRVKIAIWKRQREGRTSERHPTISEALTWWRKEHPSEVQSC